MSLAEKSDALALVVLAELRANLPSLSKADLERLARVRNLSAQIRQLTTEDATLVFRSLHPGTDAALYHFSLKSARDRGVAMKVIAIDANVSRFLPRLVPRQVNEQDFWANYMSHVVALRQRLLLGGLAGVDHAPEARNGGDDVAVSKPTWRGGSEVDLAGEMRCDMEAPAAVAPSLAFLGMAHQHRQALDAVRRTLDFGAPRMLDRVLGVFGLDRGDLGQLFHSGEDWDRLKRAVASRVCDPDFYIHALPELVLPKALREALRGFAFRMDRDEPAVVAVFALDPAGVSRALDQVVPLVVTETSGWTMLFSNLTCVVYEFCVANQQRQ
jgi:hypothetical protein